MMVRVSALLLLTLGGRLAAAADCYFADGTLAQEDYAPCNPLAEFSACCSLTKGNPDLCLSSGFCLAQENGFEGEIYANGCTDKSGKADACPQACRDKSSGTDTPKVWNLQKCSNGQYCCRDSTSSESCCDDAENRFDFNIGKFQTDLSAPTRTVVEQVSRSGSQTLAPATASAIDSATSHTASSKAQTDSCRGANAAVVGGAVGGALGAAFLASLAAIVFLCRRNPRPKSEMAKPVSVHDPVRDSVHDPVQVHELGGDTPGAHSRSKVIAGY